MTAGERFKQQTMRLLGDALERIAVLEQQLEEIAKATGGGVPTPTQADAPPPGKP